MVSFSNLLQGNTAKKFPRSTSIYDTQACLQRVSLLASNLRALSLRQRKFQFFFIIDQLILIDFFPAPYLSWDNQGNSFLFERVDRGHKRFRIIRANAATGECNTIVDEQTPTFIYEQKIFYFFFEKYVLF